MLSGIGYGDNTKAALITRGLAEMVRYGMKKGGKLETYMGLTGVGDLIVTCSSVHSRNFQAGVEIGKTNDAREFMKNNKKTCEGIRTCKVIYEDAKNMMILSYRLLMQFIMFCIIIMNRNEKFSS